MLLIVFVENAFKHLSDSKAEALKVAVRVEVTEKELYFECTNTINSKTASIENIETGKSGIGLVNVKKRLQLLYPDKHTLKINTDNNHYNVQLKLQSI